MEILPLRNEGNLVIEWKRAILFQFLVHSQHFWLCHIYFQPCFCPSPSLLHLLLLLLFSLVCFSLILFLFTAAPLSFLFSWTDTHHWGFTANYSGINCTSRTALQGNSTDERGRVEDGRMLKTRLDKSNRESFWILSQSPCFTSLWTYCISPPEAWFWHLILLH